MTRAAKLQSTVLLAIASLLVAGCYCPMLSGRYGEVGCCPSSPLPPSKSSGKPGDDSTAQVDGSCRSLRRLHHAGAGGGGLGLGGGHGLARGAELMPSQQGPDYVSPQPKFHPVPTRPAFEPQFASLPTELIVPAGSNPLRPAELQHRSLRPHPAPKFRVQEPPSR